MKNKTKTEDYWFCGRCDINTIDNPDRMCPCPRGSCEAEIIGEIKTTVEVIPKKKNDITLDDFNGADNVGWKSVPQNHSK